MKYKIFKYELAEKNNYIVAPDNHLEIFQRSIGTNSFGQFTEYRGSKNTVLMHLRKFGKDFSGLIGKYSDQREVTLYSQKTDETLPALLADDDYPNTPFICMPRIRIIACLEGRPIPAASAMARLHQILIQRTNSFLTYGSLLETVDLRKAVKRFRLTEVNFDVLPVNPHTGPLGQKLDASRAKDHIRRFRGKLEATRANPLTLDGGLLTEIQQLQQSGHAKTGFKGYSDNNTVISVSKPSENRALSENEEKKVPGEEIEINIEFPGLKFEYPFQDGHFTQIRTIVRKLIDKSDNDTT